MQVTARSGEMQLEVCFKTPEWEASAEVDSFNGHTGRQDTIE